MRSPVFVVGTGRSGTSVTARILHERLGVDMGGSSFVGPPNPERDYEDPTIKELNRTLIKGIIKPHFWRKRILAETAAKTDPWGFKHPDSAKILDRWLDLFPDAAIIWAMRDHVQSARSCSRHYGWDGDTSLRYILLRHEHIWRNLKGRLKGTLALSFSEHRDEDQLATVLRDFLKETP